MNKNAIVMAIIIGSLSSLCCAMNAPQKKILPKRVNKGIKQPNLEQPYEQQNKQALYDRINSDMEKWEQGNRQQQEKRKS